MKGCTNWNFDPYIPFDQMHYGVYIVRLAPGEGRILLEWRSALPAKSYTCLYRVRGAGVWQRQRAEADTVLLTGLADGTDYEVCIECDLGVQSPVRLARTGVVPGVVVNYIHPEDDTYAFSGHYACSPSIVRLPGGALLASHDVYGPTMPQNLTLLFRSDDDGESWRYVTQLFPCFWGTLFCHKGKLYMTAASTEYGDILVGCSQDEGKTWGAPTVIARGACHCREKGFHKAPCRVERAFGRLWTAIEYGAWSENDFVSTVFSIDENADLLDAASWTVARPLHYGRDWVSTPSFIPAIEGNVIAGPDGCLYNCMRTGTRKLLLLKIDPEHPEKMEEFAGVADFDQGHTKFEIHRQGDRYLSLGNMEPARNHLFLLSSKDLRHWEKVCDVVDATAYDARQVAFQYPAFLWEGEQLTVLSRTAFNGAHDFHDSNYITLHKLTL